MTDVQMFSGSSALHTEARAETPVTDLVEDLVEQVGTGKLSVRDVFDTVGQKSLYAVLIVPALLVISPLSGVPLFSSVCGITIAFIAAQMLTNRRHLWLPDILMRQEVAGEQAERAIGNLPALADRLDRYSRPRMQFLVQPAGRTWIQLLCMLCGLVMPMLEIVPFSSSVLGLAVVLMATALLPRDGLYAVFGMILILCAATIPVLAIGAL